MQNSKKSRYWMIQNSGTEVLIKTPNFFEKKKSRYWMTQNFGTEVLIKTPKFLEIRN